MIPGQKKKSFDRRPGFVSRRLLDYKVPRHLKTLALDPESSMSLLDSFPVLGEELRLENYAEKFKALIHLVRPIAVVISMFVFSIIPRSFLLCTEKGQEYFCTFWKGNAKLFLSCRVPYYHLLQERENFGTRNFFFTTTGIEPGPPEQLASPSSIDSGACLSYVISSDSL